MQEAKIVPPGGGRPLIVLGDNQFIKLAGEDTGGAYAVVEQINPPGVGVPMHVHALDEETFFVMEGQVAFTAGERSLVAGAGTTVHLPRGVPHAFEVIGNAPARVLLILAPAGGEQMFQELHDLPFPPVMAQVASICARYGITFLPG